MKKLCEGKSKIVWQTDDPRLVVIEYKDDLTADNGKRHDILLGKGILCTTTTCASFKVLEAAGIKTHFIRKLNERQFLAHRLKMLPIEFVVRRLAAGSYLERNPQAQEGERFSPPRIELYYKSDEYGDPRMRPECDGTFSVRNREGNRIRELEEKVDMLNLVDDRLKRLYLNASDTFYALEKAWENRGATLVDLKVEMGYDLCLGLRIGDSLDCDSWRLWVGGDRARQVDKQIFRDLVTVTPEGLEKVRHGYEWACRIAFS